MLANWCFVQSQQFAHSLWEFLLLFARTAFCCLLLKFFLFFFFNLSPFFSFERNPNKICRLRFYLDRVHLKGIPIPFFLSSQLRLEHLKAIQTSRAQLGQVISCKKIELLLFFVLGGIKQVVAILHVKDLEGVMNFYSEQTVQTVGVVRSRSTIIFKISK